MNKCVVIVPSRGRPEAAAMLRESFCQTKTTDRVSLRFALDASDPTLTQYPEGARAYNSHGPTEALNLAAAAVSTTYVGAICDEQRFVTPGWDEAILNALDEMGGGVVYPNDLINPGTMPAAVFMSTAIAKAVGYFALPSLRVNYYDNVWKDLGEGVGRLKYIDDVAIQHLSMPHPGDNSKAIEEDAYTYALWKRYQRLRDVEKAKHAIAA